MSDEPTSIPTDPASTYREGDRHERSIFRRALTIGLASLLLAVLVVPSNFNPVLRPFTVPSSSMAPTLHVGNYLIVNRLAYGLSRYSYDWVSLPIAGRLSASAPKRGDVVVYRLPRDPRTFFISRVIGLPGERVQMVKGRLAINGAVVPRQDAGKIPDPLGGRSQVAAYTERLPEAPDHGIIETEGDSGFLDDTGEFVVPAGHLFMLGDNRDNSVDSRLPADKMGVGFVPLDHLIGRVAYIF